MVLGKLPVPRRPTNLDIVEQGPTALTVGADGGCLYIFSLFFLPLSGRRWLVGCLGFNGPLRQYFSLYRAVNMAYHK